MSWWRLSLPATVTVPDVRFQPDRSEVDEPLRRRQVEPRSLPLATD
jgi:hypothetical protein